MFVRIMCLCCPLFRLFECFSGTFLLLKDFLFSASGLNLCGIDFLRILRVAGIGNGGMEQFLVNFWEEMI